ncbi:hypothetical protein ASPFODRAFT_39571 [Aspergillus luchuensis CBS 106.47]|uniref:Uncharacterized protein n=1 Tax=Aspergillus luchuensis (strain CBS 106.47) TaxID=1137211 RepID=A0A1M3TZP6_ASPLC|nr:hypothetical protein ASPFODRAFT_39571 [Aspergillus luchuensis CBS 106.47]
MTGRGRREWIRENEGREGEDKKRRRDGEMEKGSPKREDAQDTQKREKKERERENRREEE